MVKITSNPYENVDWGSVSHIKSDHHYHSDTTKSNPPPHEMADQLVDELGYSVLTIDDGTSGGTVWPWTEWSSFYDHWEDRDPETDFDNDVLPVEGMEYGAADHTVGLFSDLQPDDLDDVESWYEQVEEIVDNGGLAVLEHPARYTDSDGAVERYADGYADFDDLVGFAALNKDAGNMQRDDIHSWDALLSELMPDRPIWVFSHDDSNGWTVGSDVDVRWNTLFVEDLTDSRVRSAYEEGAFTASERLQWDDGSETATQAPEVSAIHADDSEPSITVETDADRIMWICQGWVVGDAQTLELTDAMDKYVRAELVNESSRAEGRTLTQPFGVDGDGPTFRSTSEATWTARSESQWSVSVNQS